MLKSVSKILATALALMLVVASIACLAETRQVRELDGYEPIDSESHYAIYTVWEGEATEDGGISSGKIVDEVSEVEPHEFDKDGVCVLCGYELPVIPVGGDDDDDDDDTTTTTKTADTTDTTKTADTTDTTKTADTTETTETTETAEQFTNASGITVAVGAPAAKTLKQVFAAIPANTEVSFDGVDKEVADALIAALNEGATPAELLEILANFPTQLVDGVPCYVVTISYTDAAGTPVTENYAFSTADGTLVKVF